MNQEKVLADVFPNITYSSQYQCQNWGTLVCSLNWPGDGWAGALLLEWTAADDITDHGDEEGDSEAGHHDH